MRVFLSLLFIALCNTCTAQDSVLLRGHIAFPLSDTVSITYNTNVLAYAPVTFYAVLDKDGNFSIAFPVLPAQYTQATLNHGNKNAELLLKKGHTLALNVDAKHFDSTIHYTGKGAAVENFLARHSIEKGTMNQYPNLIKPNIPKAPIDFEKDVNAVRSGEMLFLEKNKEGLSADFIQYWAAYYKYYTYFCILQYPQAHEVTVKKRYTDTIPEANYAVLKNVPFAFNDSFITIMPYLLYTTSVLEKKLKASGYSFYAKDTTGTQRFNDSISVLAATKMPDKTAEYYFAQHLYGLTRYQPLQKTETDYTAFKRRWPNSNHLPVLQKHVDIAEKLAPGQPAPDMDITSPEGKPMKLSDLKGKVVYLGFWAPWCRQCVGEMISEKKVKDFIKDKPVAFVYVSLGDDRAKEKKLLDRYKIDGYFVNTIGGWQSEEVEKFGVESLPTYYLIDTNGNFATQNPPGPISYTELAIAIGKLLK